MPSAVESLASPLTDMCACVCHMSRRVVVAGCTGAPYTHMHTVCVCTRCARTLVLARGPLCACRDQLCIGYCYRLSWVMAFARHPSVPVWATTRKGMALLPLCRPPPPSSTPIPGCCQRAEATQVGEVGALGGWCASAQLFMRRACALACCVSQVSVIF